ncbi:hypothetical protein TCAL_15849 [Tigriopus californicus]|uniref:Uncharacterized protein n=1 Tax=Tigriopus californicus TaxID=6832 RepID=A0A553NQN9_TIGCA|nr:hypothetical protein TCAL_15849 [Tigriopus californicus]
MFECGTNRFYFDRTYNILNKFRRPRPRYSRCIRRLWWIVRWVGTKRRELIQFGQLRSSKLPPRAPIALQVE